MAWYVYECWGRAQGGGLAIRDKKILLCCYFPANNRPSAFTPYFIPRLITFTARVNLANSDKLSTPILLKLIQREHCERYEICLPVGAENGCLRTFLMGNDRHSTPILRVMLKAPITSTIHHHQLFIPKTRNIKRATRCSTREIWFCY